MTAPQDTVTAFEELVAQAEASAGKRNVSDLATYQLQALSTTLSQLAGPDSLPGEVSAALDAVRGYIGGRGGRPDQEEGERLRSKVAAYAVVAEDLGLDPAHLGDLVSRWDAAFAPPRRSGRRRGRGEPAATPSAGGTTSACTICGRQFKRVAKHMSSAHPDEWAKARNA